MNEQTGNPPCEGDADQIPARTDKQIDPSHHEAAEIEGWALQWDTTALRKASLAKKMRQLRQAAADQ